MIDPTYNQDEINANPIWELAHTISEICNDNAPIGWSKYISLASSLLNSYNIEQKIAK